eukprot:jgi/Chrzof1/11724/Cz06g07040.t1
MDGDSGNGLGGNGNTKQQEQRKCYYCGKKRDLGEATSYLGMSIQRNRQTGTIKIGHRLMITELLEKYGAVDSKIKSVPLSPSIKLAKDEGGPLDKEHYPYSQLVGSLMYLAITSRPDLAFSVGALARYMSCPTTVHWQAAKGVLRYLGGTLDYGITFGSDSNDLIGYCDADYAGDTDTRKSTSGYIFILHGGAITWSSKRQATVAASTTEAEYMAAAAAVKEALWLRTLLSELQLDIDNITIMADNQSAIKLLRNPISSMRTKHIDVAYHFARERVVRKEVVFSVEIRPLFSQTCTARIQKFPDGSGSPQMFPDVLDVSKCVQKFLEVSRCF